MSSPKSRLLFVNIFVSLSVFFLSCSIPQTKNQIDFSPILLRKYFAEIELGQEQISNNPQLAIEYFNKAIEKSLNRPEAFTGRGIARLELKQYTLAIKDLDMALEADWSVLKNIQERNTGKSSTYYLRALAGIGLLKTIDVKKDVQAWSLAFGRIILDFDMAEFHALLTEDHELLKTITKTRHLFDTAKERGIRK